MKGIARLVRRYGIEEIMVALRRWSNAFRGIIPVRLRRNFPSFGRFIPASTEYPADDCYQLTRDNTVFSLNRSDYVQWRIFYGVRDNALKRAKQTLHGGTTVLDIGASCGGFSLRLARYAKQKGIQALSVHAFEPNPVIYERYRDNLALNPEIAATVHVHPYGFGAEACERYLYVPKENSGAGRVISGVVQNAPAVKIQRLDDFIRTLQPASISFIKMIVEGFEPDVFRGGWETVGKFRPVLFFEVTPAWYQQNGTSLDEITGPLKKLGYSFEAEFQNEMMAYEPEEFKAHFQYYLLATPGR